MKFSEDVFQWLEEYKEQIEILFLPLYIYELSPDEYFNGDLDQRIHSGWSFKTEKDSKYDPVIGDALKSIQLLHIGNYLKADLDYGKGVALVLGILLWMNC